MSRFVRSLSMALALFVAHPPPFWGAGEASSEHLARYLRGREQAGFSGAVLVMQGSEVLLRDAYGFADVELAVPNTPDTVFRIGSLSKPLVATAVLRLVARGRLDLYNSLFEHVPSIPAAWRQVTIEQLLSHTSGIPDLFGEVSAGPPGDLRELVDQTLSEHAGVALASEAGSRYAYSNFGYLLLAYVVETVEESPWLEVLQREVFSPAAMRRARYDDVWEIVPGRARGYRRQQGVLRNTQYKDHGAFSAGGLLSTADDLQRFVAALDAGALLPPELHNRMVTPVRGSYALGWQVTRFFDRPVINHSGGIGGFSAHVAYYTADRLFLAVLSNVEGTPAKPMACDLAALVLGTESPVLDRRPAADPDPSWLDLVAGDYVSEDGEIRTVARQGEGLILRRGDATYALVPTGSRSFVTDDIPGVALVFEGPSDEPAAAFSARACGSVLFSAHRTEAPPPGLHPNPPHEARRIDADG